MRPGRGYGLIVLDEVELGVGRPDVVILSLSGAALRAWIDRGLRLQNWTEARVLAGAIDPRERVSAAVGHEHVRVIERRLRFRGWDGRALRPAVREAYLLEAKVTDWRTGLVQLTHRQLFQLRRASPAGVSRATRPAPATALARSRPRRRRR